MNSKIVFAFIGGALMASAVVYLAVRPEGRVEDRVADTVKPAQTQPAAAALPETTPAQATTPQAAPPPSTPPVEAEPVPAGKPSPVEPLKKEPVQAKRREPQPVHHEQKTRQHVVAQLDPPPTLPLPPQNVAPAPQPASQPAPVAAPPPQPPPAPIEAKIEPPPQPKELEPPPPVAPTVTIAAGTALSVRVGETLSTQRSKQGDRFMATLEQPLVVDGFVIAERGARCLGRVMQSDPGGKVKGTAELQVDLFQVTLSDGQHVRIRTAPYQKQADASHGTDAAKVGGGAALGAIIGALAGGGKGAGIGAAAGGAAGAGDVMLTRGKPAVIPVETRLSFRLQDPVTVTEQK
ncbi:MAG TPA: hypothetical protein VKU01_00790 [Bryobacteraceae bacterium]|nr:hypothetical protein [Bryobacteraceae bacterium]